MPGTAWLRWLVAGTAGIVLARGRHYWGRAGSCMALLGRVSSWRALLGLCWLVAGTTGFVLARGGHRWVVLARGGHC